MSDDTLMVLISREKLADLVKDAFWEGAEDSNRWNSTMGPMSQSEMHQSWMESDGKSQMDAWWEEHDMFWVTRSK